MKLVSIFLLVLCAFCACNAQKEKSNAYHINPFICTGGDHGQTDVAAAVPFGMVKPCPDSDPINHSGYNFESDKIFGFSNTRFSGVGCKGTGGNLRIIPFVDPINIDKPGSFKIDKSTEIAVPGYYSVQLENGIKAELTATRQIAIHRYHFPANVKQGILIDLASSFMKTLNVDFTIKDNIILGDVKCTNVCDKGKYKFYFAIKVDGDLMLVKKGNKVFAEFQHEEKSIIDTYVSVSTVSSENAYQTLIKEQPEFNASRKAAFKAWAELVDVVDIETDDIEQKQLFYTHLYHVAQSPFVVQDFNGQYRGSDEKIYQLPNGEDHYFGWSVWDTFRSKHPLLSVLYPEQYTNILASMCTLYQQGKQPWATQTEPYPTIRTEHTVVLLLDGLRKGLLDFDLNEIYYSIKNEIDNQLEWHSPGHILESSYDSWAFAQIAKVLGHEEDYKHYMDIAMNYRETWNKVFMKLEDDADKMHARGIYEGTLWQYRWFVPFDIEGIQTMLGGKEVFEKQLDEFFEKELFNVGNQPDIQVPFLYNYTNSPWKSQQLVQKLLTGELNNWYGTHFKRKEPEFRKIFQTTPQGYITQMDDDAGTMSGWYLLASLGLYQTCPGESYFWVTIPLYKSCTIKLPHGKTFTMKVEGPRSENAKITELVLNGKKLNNLSIDYSDIYNGGTLVVKTCEDLN
ncbi:glycoside hydrolase family 92 protein [Puteibacter caeruleilacunae]|nr:glycoside hydrolase family 92 protein [Puteibacter caeruleilacunae]